MEPQLINSVVYRYDFQGIKLVDLEKLLPEIYTEAAKLGFDKDQLYLQVDTYNDYDGYPSTITRIDGERPETVEEVEARLVREKVDALKQIKYAEVRLAQAQKDYKEQFGAN